MKIVAKIISVGEERKGTSQRTGNEWKSCDFVIEGLESGHKYVLTTFSTTYISEIQSGIVRDFEFHGEANEYNGKWYNRLSLDRMSNVNISNEDRLQKAATPTGSVGQSDKPSQEPQTKERVEQSQPVSEEQSTLPF